MDWAHQRRVQNLFTYDWYSAPTASATSRDYSQGNFHQCHSTTHGICVPSLEWRTHSKPTKTTRFSLQETWDSPASATDSIRLSLSGSALQDEIKYCTYTAILMHTPSPASFSNYRIFISKVRVPSSSHKKIINIGELSPTVDSPLERTAEGNPRVPTLWPSSKPD